MLTSFSACSGRARLSVSLLSAGGAPYLIASANANEVPMKFRPDGVPFGPSGSNESVFSRTSWQRRQNNFQPHCQGFTSISVTESWDEETQQAEKQFGPLRLQVVIHRFDLKLRKQRLISSVAGNPSHVFEFKP